MAPTQSTLLNLTVPTEDICVLCLTRLVSNSKYTSFMPISEYLDVDIRKIFNIQEETLRVGGGGRDKNAEEKVNVDVMLCKSCAVLRNAFSDMYREYVKIGERLDVCLKGIHDVMKNADGNVTNVRQYINVIAGGSKSLEKIKSSIPEKFRRETLSKCYRKITKTTEIVRVRESAATEGEEPEPDLYCDEKVGLSDNEEEKPGVEIDEFEAEFLKEVEGEMVIQTKPAAAAGSSSSSSRSPFKRQSQSSAGQMQFRRSFSEDDDDDDPEDLMRKYEIGSLKRSKVQLQDLLEHGNVYEDQDNLPLISKGNPKFSISGEGEEMEIEIDLGDEDEGDESMSMSSASSNVTPNKVENESNGKKVYKPGSYGGKFECELCGKVVVSLKNFELHQRRHAGEKPFECQHCNKTFRDTSNLRSHVLRYHRQYLFIKFKMPGISIEQFKDGLDSLILSILKQKPNDQSSTNVAHGCQLCGRYYTQRYAIEDHIVQRHYDVLAMSISNLQLQIHNMTKDECLSHMIELKDSGNTARKCGLCGARFDNADGLNMHVKTHIKVSIVRNIESSPVPAPTGNDLIRMKLKCEPCGRYFDDLQALNAHKRLAKGSCSSVPSADSLIKCEHCGKCLNTQHSYRRHLLSLHRYQVFSKYLPPGSKPAEVEEIIKSIFENAKVEKQSTGFPCFICNKIITELRKLNSHVLVSHLNEIVHIVKEKLLQRKVAQIPNAQEIVAGAMQNNLGIQIIEIDSDDDDDASPKILRVVDGNGDEISIENGVPVTANMEGSIFDHDIKFEYGNGFS